MQTARFPSDPKAAIHLKNILVPVDFSGPSEQAVIYGMRMAAHFGATVTLLYVVEARPSSAARPDIIPHLKCSRDEATAAEGRLRSLARMIAPGASKKAGVQVRSGLAAHQIVDAAKELDTDLIVIATRGYTGWKHFCIGSTAERVVRTAPCPVLVVREKEHEFI